MGSYKICKGCEGLGIQQRMRSIVSPSIVSLGVYWCPNCGTLLAALEKYPKLGWIYPTMLEKEGS